MSVTPRRKIRIFFLKWHRTLGLAAALFVLVLVGTGIALNHGNSLSLDHDPAPSWALPLYGIEPALPGEGFQAGEQWLVESERQLFFNNSGIGRCAPPLIGAVALDGMILAICQDILYLFTASGELIESSVDIPEPLLSLQGKDSASSVALVQGRFRQYQFDVDAFSWLPLPNAAAIQSVKSQTLPVNIAEAIAADRVIADITWERFLLDLHSGRLFGDWGVWFVDLVAIILAVLAVSGVWLRLSRPGRKH